MRGERKLSLAPENRPKVLLLGNGILRLGNGKSWSALLDTIRQNEVPAKVMKEIPYCMRPEVLYGTDIEGIRKTLAEKMQLEKPADSKTFRHLLDLGFDCILTTNYSYEPESVFLGEGKEFTNKQRVKALRTFSNASKSGGDNSKKQINLHMCYEMPYRGKNVQVWHIHGDAMRQNSLVLSYHSYIKGMASLWEYSKSLGDSFTEHQANRAPLPVGSWLEWFLAGDVYSVGYGWDFSELDLWWAMERNAREHGQTGKKHVFFFSKESYAAKEALLKTYGAEVHVIATNAFDAAAYEQVIAEIKAIQAEE